MTYFTGLRTAEQVLQDHRAALASGDVKRDVKLNYAENAVVITVAGTDRGRDDIARSLENMVKLLGEAVPVVHSETVTVLDDATSIAQVVFSISSPRVKVTDGVDTYVIKDGQIYAQTVHVRPVFRTATSPR